MTKTSRKGDNAVFAYLRSTRAELRKVRWPTLEQGWAMTKIVVAVTFAMAVFLGVLDFFFGWLLGQIVTGSALYMVLGVVVAAALIVAVYFVGRAEEV
ncbi:MAG: preprotein translocase subunit SecE [Anaerolineae bacterium]|nr:preprotein translocase subunit SecE [Anaerolineae bacterium]